jgi:SAM-dependent methyltransferase
MNEKGENEPQAQLFTWQYCLHYYDISLFSQAITLEKFIRTILAFVPRSGTILETGFGSGTTSVLLADLGYQVTAIDIGAELVDELRGRARNLANLNVLRADMFNLPFQDDSFYAVIHQGVLEHFGDEEISKALQEQKRVTRRYIIFDVPNDRVKIPAAVRGTPFDYQLRSKRTWKAFIKDCGLSLEGEYGRGWGYDRLHLCAAIYNLIPLFCHRRDMAKINSRFNLLGKWLGRENGFVCSKP